ncbi:MAG: thiamine pyrophosphate-requiring protein [Bradyrhizobiaceae bacterium]|nr:thiamine pyrophosphate-requiring protein [Bradyrhizobiaceae bacterium]
MSARPTAQKHEKPARPPIAGELFLSALAAHGVDYFFCNPGTDFPPVVEAFTRAQKTNRPVPQPVLVTHENLAVAMAHGAYLMNGRPQAVMVHVNVGTANTINNLANLSRDRAPFLLAAGRTPITESGQFGGRMRQIHWGQEMFDQAGMVRELVKWDYELRVPGQVGDVVSRALEVAMTSPRGPVYLALPREPLSAELDGPIEPVQPRAVAASPYPDPASIEKLARWIADAENPVLITAAAGREPHAVELLAKFAERWAVPVVSFNTRYLNLPSTHPMHQGFDPGALLAEADVAILLECEVPWFPIDHTPRAGCKFAHMGEDPAFVRYPIRSFPSDLTITASARNAIAALDAALAKAAPDAGRISARFQRLSEQSNARRSKAGQAAAAQSDKITVPYASKCVGDAVGLDAVIFNEYPLSLEHCPREKPGTYFGSSTAGGLGWGLGAALGAKLAAPEKLVVATLGDGTYMFTNPTVSHWVAERYKLPVLTIIFNNSRYGAVRRATLSMFQDGAAGEDDGRFLADLDPSPPYDEFVKAQGGFGARVERPQDLPEVLARARDAVVKEKRQALVNVITPY